MARPEGGCDVGLPEPAPPLSGAAMPGRCERDPMGRGSAAERRDGAGRRAARPRAGRRRAAAHSVMARSLAGAALFRTRASFHPHTRRTRVRASPAPAPVLGAYQRVAHTPSACRPRSVPARPCQPAAPIHALPARSPRRGGRRWGRGPARRDGPNGLQLWPGSSSQIHPLSPSTPRSIRFKQVPGRAEARASRTGPGRPAAA